MRATDIDTLIIAYHKAGKTWLDPDTEITLRNVRVADDELTYSVEYGDNRTYRDDFRIGMTELLLWYINARLEVLHG